MSEKNDKTPQHEYAKIVFDPDITQHALKAKHKIGMRKEIIGFAISMTSSLLSSVVFAVGFLSFRKLGSLLPVEYIDLIATVLSALIGISVIFLVTRELYRRHKRRRMEILESIQQKDSELFKTIEHDFDLMVQRKDVYGG